MTLDQYVAYETILKPAGFEPSTVAQTQHQNWIKKYRTADDRAIVRVFLASDGHFKAYSSVGNVLGSGVSAWELKGCI